MSQIVSPELASTDQDPYVRLDSLLVEQAPATLPEVLEPVKVQTLRWKGGALLSDEAWRAFVGQLLEEGPSHQGEHARRFRPHMNDLDCYKLCRRMMDVAPLGVPWSLYILAVIGSPFQIEALGRNIEDVASESESVEPALQMVDVLERQGQSEAIRWLEHWSEHSAHTRVRNACHEALETMAGERTTSVDDLVDSALPWFGFERDGEQLIDYGNRHVVVRLTPDGRFSYADDTGKVLKMIPGKRRGDDLEAVKQGKKKIRTLRREVKEARAKQARRLERAMGYGRAWPVPVWRARFVDHPVMRGLARKLVFVHTSEKEQETVFAVSPDGPLHDVNGVAIKLVGGKVHLVHPVNLPEPELNRWKLKMKARGKAFKPPFSQLGRKVHRCTPAHDSWDKVVKDSGVPAARDMRKRRKALSYKSKVEQDGAVTFMRRIFGPYTIVLEHRPFAAATLHVADPVKLCNITVKKGDMDLLPNELPPEVYSEVVQDTKRIFKTSSVAI